MWAAAVGSALLDAGDRAGAQKWLTFGVNKDPDSPLIAALARRTRRAESATHRAPPTRRHQRQPSVDDATSGTDETGEEGGTGDGTDPED
jgi:hypothetical protein